MGGRHRKPPPSEGFTPPAWLLREENPCVISVAEEVYAAQDLATGYGAPGYPQCAELLAAAQKSMRALSNTRADTKKRCAAGERALRKFWEAKTCARRLSGAVA